MKLWQVAAASATVIGAGMLLYGAAVESEEITVEKKTLRLPKWPAHLAGYKIALLADFHLRGPLSLQLCKKAIAAALEAEPDMVALGGDIVAYWAPEFIPMLGEMLEPLRSMNGSVVAVPGNHDYDMGTPELFQGYFDDLNIKLLRNQSWKYDGITWVGVDSAIMHRDFAELAMKWVEPPAVCLWHEPDVVDKLPEGCALMLSGHSHGGQFRFPGGYTPMSTHLGKRYPRGFYPDASTPLYVSRGIGTTGPPSRFLCSPEVAILTLMPAH